VVQSELRMFRINSNQLTQIMLEMLIRSGLYMFSFNSNQLT